MAQPGGLSRTHRRDEEQDNLVGGSGPGQGSARGNGAAGRAVSGRISGGGHDNNGTRVQGNSMANMGTSRNVQFSQGVDTSVGQGVRRPSGRGGHTWPSRGRGGGADRDRGHAHSIRQFPSPQRNDFFSPAILQGPPFRVEGARIGRRRGGSGTIASLRLLICSRGPTVAS